jgi:hypothetical protein
MVEISAALCRQAKELAARNGTPLRLLCERGLDGVLKNAKRPPRRFRMRSITTNGDGLVCDDWGKIRALIYEGHGG